MTRSLPLILTSLLVGLPATSLPTKAALPLSSLFWSVCVRVYDLHENFDSKERDDLAEQVARFVQTRVESVEPGRRIVSAPNCIKSNQPGFDRQLFLDLSVKRQKIKLDNQDLELAVAGGVGGNGLFQDRDLQPVVILKRAQILDGEVVKALEEFVDRSVVETIRRQPQK